MVSGIRMKVNSICDFPESHELEDDEKLAKLGVQKTYYNNYKIFFVIDDEMSTVYVVRVLHMRVDSRARLYETFGIAV